MTHLPLPRPASSFDSYEELEDYWTDRADRADDEAQGADDACSEGDDQ